MCGIGGILRTDGQPIPDEWLDAIDARIAYRGPDGHGRFRDRVEIADAAAPGGKRIVEVAFVHRRLSIIDHSGGHQPMVSERGRNEKEGLVAVVFNGCIYNHRELRKELEAKGHTFVTDHSDTEVLIHGWREWGKNLIEHLEGMYAFAIWDRSHASLALGRDMFGEKPLYVADASAFLISSDDSASKIITFASDAGVIADLTLEVDQIGEWQYEPVQGYLLLGYLGAGLDSEGRSVFDEQGANSICEYFRDATPTRTLHIPAILNGKQARQPDFDRLIEQAVARRLDADVPLGCFLSGGIDSSLVAHAAKKHKSDLMTFSVRMPDPRYDESRYAEAVAKRLGTRHQTLDVAASPADDLVTLVRTLGQPFGDSSILPTYWVSKAVRQHAKVALSGDGGDELFVGYERYTAARSLSRYRAMIRLLPSSPLVASHPKSLRHKVARAILAARDYQHLGLLALESIFRPSDIADLQREFTHPPLYPNLFIEPLVQGYLVDAAAQSDSLSVLRAWDVAHYLPGDLLRKVDTASMACGLEVRCPFLDRDLARAALAAPIEQLMPGGQRKGLMRQIARKYLPKEIVDRPKMGFAIPIGEWFRSDYGSMKTLLLDHLNSAEPFGPIQLNRKAVQRFIDEHMSGKRDHGQRLFTLLTLSIWARQVAK